MHDSKFGWEHCVSGHFLSTSHMKHTIENSFLKVTVNELGAELTSIIRKSDNCEMLWQGDAKYWHGQSPILFPTIGNSANQSALFGDKRLPMPKHGLVRGMVWSKVSGDTEQVTLQCSSTDETLQHYPFPFRLTVTYSLDANVLNITFDTYNDTNIPLPFHLGAHPAFNLPEFDENDGLHGFMSFNVNDKLVSDGLKPGGLRWAEGAFDVALDKNGMLSLDNHTFDSDTILDTRGLAHACILYNKERKALVGLRFNSPVLALWAPKGGCCPFVCIEPWWGCCDDYGFESDFSQRHWINITPAQSSKRIQYSISIL